MSADAAQYCDRCGANLAARQTIVQPEMWRTETSFLNAEKLNIHSENGGAENQNSPEQNGGAALQTMSSTRAASTTNANQNAQKSLNANGAHALLRIERGKTAGKEFLLREDEINIGRWDADNGVFPDVDLDADDPEAKVSRRHARIVRRDDNYLIEDLNSTNGTFVNRSRRLTKGNSQILLDGDEIIVGKTFLRFQILR